jgi:hypothetical protein
MKTTDASEYLAFHGHVPGEQVAKSEPMTWLQHFIEDFFPPSAKPDLIKGGVLVERKIGSNDDMALLSLVSKHVSLDEGRCRLDVIVEKKKQGRWRGSRANVARRTRAEIRLRDDP